MCLFYSMLLEIVTLWLFHSMLLEIVTLVYLTIHHRCTRVENTGEGVWDVFAKIPRGGVKGFRKNCQGGVHLFCIFINKFFENLPGGVLFHNPLPPYPPCVHLCYTFIFYLKNIFLTDILINIVIVQNLLPRLFIAWKCLSHKGKYVSQENKHFVFLYLFICFELKFLNFFCTF